MLILFNFIDTNHIAENRIEYILKKLIEHIPTKIGFVNCICLYY